jgi:hypothetical protein
MDVLANARRQESALNDLDAISRRLERGEISTEAANDQILAVMQALERDTAGHAEEMKKYYAKQRLKIVLMLLAPFVAFGAIAIWLVYK